MNLDSTWVRLWIALSVTLWTWFNSKAFLDSNAANPYEWEDAVFSVPAVMIICGVIIGIARLWAWAIP